MALARRWGGVITVAVAVAIGAALYTGVGRDPEGSGTGREAPPLGAVPGVMPLAGAAKCTPSEPAAALVIHGYVHAPRLDLARWRVRGLPLRYDECETLPVSEIDSRGRFELTGLEDVDYRVELVQEGERLIVIASSDHVRPGGDELVLELDPLALASLREYREYSVRAEE
jgi:hypothetical protein